ncbi:nucleotidyltransferase domain-containing protein [Candidatus Calescamantes bacterium]|nr:nucleotidyltransferase domain-containing protein [Candidatus Calescamantes bacterium]
MIRKNLIRHNLNSLLSELKERLEKEKDIIFAYIIGSYAKGKRCPLSDFDIAVYIENNQEIFDRKISLNSLITDILKTDEVDLIILNEASPLFIHHSLRNGKLLFSKDEKKRISFLVKNLKEYFDMQYYYERFKKGILKRIEEGKYGM